MVYLRVFERTDRDIFPAPEGRSSSQSLWVQPLGATYRSSRSRIPRFSFRWPAFAYPA